MVSDRDEQYRVSDFVNLTKITRDDLRDLRIRVSESGLRDRTETEEPDDEDLQDSRGIRKEVIPPRDVLAQTWKKIVEPIITAMSLRVRFDRANSRLHADVILGS